jgi:hypothetical protein
MKAPTRKGASTKAERRVRLTLTRAESLLLMDTVDDSVSEFDAGRAPASLLKLQRTIHARTGEKMPPGRAAAADTVEAQVKEDTRKTATAATPPTARQPSWTAHYDALTLELEQADALTTLVADRLSDLSDELPDNTELYAVSLVTTSVSDKLQLILQNAIAMHDAAKDNISWREEGRCPGKGERSAEQSGGAQ